MFINEAGKKYDIPSPDAEAGLYVRTRGGKEFQVRVPKDSIAFQIGESSQVLTGGLLRATPHAVQVRW
jgi:isopenicillin N synthase-like dioxygenase